MTLTAPFPWFGGKRRVAHIVWERFGDVPNYVEPFAGSLAVLLARPHEPRVETVNDLDCYVANFWRALQAAPDEIAEHADWPVNEADLHARHLWLVDQAAFRERMKTDPDHYDAKIAGWWVWGISQWIGSGWCQYSTGERLPAIGAPRGIHARGVPEKRPRLGRGGRGVTREDPPIKQNIPRKLPRSDRGGTGIDRRTWQQKPDVSGSRGASGRGVVSLAKSREAIAEWMRALADRLRRVRVVCGDWTRILGPSPTTCIGTTAIFLDPPYSGDTGRAACYSQEDFAVAHDVRAWALKHGDDSALRIALCGYAGEHDDLKAHGWSVVAWKAHGGYSNRMGKANENAERERIWFSPHCLVPQDVGEQETIEGMA